MSSDFFLHEDPPPPLPPPLSQGVHGEKMQQVRMKLKLKLELPRDNIDFATSSPGKTRVETECETQNYFDKTEKKFPDSPTVTGVVRDFGFSSPTPFDQSDRDRWQVVEYGCAGTLRYRLLLADKCGNILSPWHDIPLHRYPSRLFPPHFSSPLTSPCSSVSPSSYFSCHSSSLSFPSPCSSVPTPTSCPSSSHSMSFSPFSSSSVFRFVCTTPAGTWLQCQVASQEPFSPLKMKNDGGVPARFSENTEWNLGLLPQTWSGSYCRIRKDCKSRPMGLPVEAIDIGTRVAWTGEVYGLKTLAAVLVVEEGVRIGWRIVGISEDDVMAKKLRGLKDIERFLPRRLDSIQAWLWNQTVTKNRDGAKTSLSPLMGQIADERTAVQVVQRAHATWRLHMTTRQHIEENLLMSADAYDAIWQRSTANIADVSTPLCEQEETPSKRYEKAWVQSMTSDKNADSENSDNFRDFGHSGDFENFGKAGNSGNSGNAGNSGNSGDSQSCVNLENWDNSGNLGNLGNLGNSEISKSAEHSRNSGNSGNAENSRNSGNSGNCGNLEILRTSNRSRSAKNMKSPKLVKEPGKNLNHEFHDGFLEGSPKCSMHKSKEHSCPFSETEGTNLYRDFFSRKCANVEKMWPVLAGTFVCGNQM